MNRSDYDRVWKLAFESFDAPLSVDERAVADGFVLLFRLLKNRGISLIDA
ncbi:MAG: hypothetical protein HY235_14680 [Acidobacteria bacterium]|nr:hypothetical protein [Acidobacteriota bacterium]